MAEYPGRERSANVFGGNIDCRRLELSSSGCCDVAISALDGGSRGTFAPWQARSDGSPGRAFGLNGKNDRESVKVGCLLEKGDYFVSFESKSRRSGGNTSYAVEFSGTTFYKADFSNNDWRHAQSVAAAGGAVTGERVGFADLTDYWTFELAGDGVCSLKISRGDGDAARLTPFRRFGRHRRISGDGNLLFCG